MGDTVLRIVIAALLAAALTGGAAAQPPPAGVPQMPPTVVGDPGPTGRRVMEDGVLANFYPAHPGGPTVVLLGGSEGGLQAGGKGITRALEDAGFNVLNVCYFGCPGTPATFTNVPLETFDRAIAWLKRQPSVDPGRIVLLGGSKGAEAGLLVAVRHPELKAVAVGMPSSVTWPGITFTPDAQPGWTEAGRPLPYLPYASFSSMGKGGIFALYNDALPALPDHPDAAIPVERIEAPVMLICGEADTLWPSCPMADRIEARLRAHGRPAAVLLRYKDAGHAVLGVPVDKADPNYARIAAMVSRSVGGTPDGNADARTDGWPKLVSFLKSAVQ